MRPPGVSASAERRTLAQMLAKTGNLSGAPKPERVPQLVGEVSSARAEKLDARIRGTSVKGLRWGAADWLFIAIMAIGVFARTWEFGAVPAGMYSDELSVAIDAYSLLHFGVDRNLVSFPVFLVSWGEGTSALYAYLVMPFMALGGSSPFTFRLPMLLSGILSLPLMYLIARHIGGPVLGLLSMFLLAISPWHVMATRWGLECNILPFVFALGFLFLLKSTEDQRWFVPGMVCMALSLYAYAPAFAAVPIFLVLVLPLLRITRAVSGRTLVVGVLVFALLAAPIAAFIVVNTLHLESLHIGPVTIPRLPTTPRFASVLSPLGDGFLQGPVRNAGIMGRLLLTQIDDQIFNTLPPYGYLYRYTFPVAVFGLCVLAWRAHSAGRTKSLLLGAWLASAVAIGLLQDVNVNRINLIFIPLIVCVAVAVDWLRTRSSIAYIAVLAAFLIGFGFFTRDYHAPGYRSRSAAAFWTGAVPAVAYASQQGSSTICITGRINYVVVLFHQTMTGEYRPQPLDFRRPTANLRDVRHIFPYTFGISRCPEDDGAVYVLAEEKPPSGGTYATTRFDRFTVYVPQQSVAP